MSGIFDGLAQRSWHWGHMVEESSWSKSRIGRAARTAKGRIFFFDLVFVLIAFLASVVIGEGSAVSGASIVSRWPQALAILFVAVGVFRWRRLYLMNSRYLGLYDAVNIAFVGAILGACLLVIQAAFPSMVPFRWSVPALFMFLLGSGLMAVRLFRRSVYQKSHYPLNVQDNAARTLVIGAGDAGEMVWREVSRSDSAPYYIVGFVDDAQDKHGSTIHGVEVLGGVDQVPDLVDTLRIEDIIIAIPSAKPEQLRRIFDICSRTQSRIRTIPSYVSLISNNEQVLPLMREISLEDLLRRDAVCSDISAVEKYIEGERVLITGAGGSIGSELARQVASVHPASLVLLGRGENSIFEIDQELRHTQVFQSTPVICDVRDVQGLRNAFLKHSPSVVIHAAAHKHVPLMEAVPIEAILNNVFGTLNVVEEAVRTGVKKCILVSTDKAVKPSSIMGATKRLGEMIISSISARSECAFATVRFGNVLGSRGSLVPILEKQIKRGGPVTITHPDMSRYFMTIPEAVQLILEAGSMGDSGQIYILDMGQPVKIVDLVHDMIRMHGLVPGQDIEIQFTGARPGEKFHEELASDRESIRPSGHDKIQVVDNENRIEWSWLKAQLMVLRDHCEAGDEFRARELLMELAWGKNIPPIQTMMIDRAVVDEVS